MKKDKESLLAELSVFDVSEEHALISEPLLNAWYNDDSFQYIPQPSVLAQALCEHKLFGPRKFHLVKCVRKEAVSLYLLFMYHSPLRSVNNI